MKKTLFAATLVGVTALSIPTFAAEGVAADAVTSVDLQLSGALQKRCEIYTGVTPTFTSLDLESTAAQGSGSLVVSCNYTGGTTVTFTSLNAGVLANQDDGASTLRYGFIIDGSANAAENSQLELTEPLVEADLFNVSADLLNDPALSTDERAIQVQLIETAVVAGTYTDIITASVQPN